MAQSQLATIHIKDLSLKTFIGIFAWEQLKKQKVIVNVWMEYDAGQAIATDKIQHAVDYKSITKRIINNIENNKYFLIERLAQKVLDITFEEKKVLKATVRVDKPGALRFADSVSVELFKKRSK